MLDNFGMFLAPVKEEVRSRGEKLDMQALLQPGSQGNEAC